MEQRTEVELRHIDPARCRARRYHMAESRSLFGERGLIITWGGIGRPARVRFEAYGSEAELDARWRELLARRRAHGYARAPAAARFELTFAPNILLPARRPRSVVDQCIASHVSLSADLVADGV